MSEHQERHDGAWDESASQGLGASPPEPAGPSPAGPDASTPDTASTDADDLGTVPLFPLPNVVLFPRAVLPLHIFEERYKAMMRHALDADRRIAMALLRPGWEKRYHGRPEIDSVVCVGSILTHEKLPDGRYNFLLQGVARARIVQETGEGPFRLAQLRRLRETHPAESTLRVERQRMLDAFTLGPLADTVAGRQFSRLLSTALPTADLADLIAFSFIEDVALKQSLLTDADVGARVAGTVEALEEICPLAPVFSPRAFSSPSMN